MSSVPCSRLALCGACFLVMEDVRPSMGSDGRHSTIDCQANKIDPRSSNDDCRPKRSSSDLCSIGAKPSRVATAATVALASASLLDTNTACRCPSRDGFVPGCSAGRYGGYLSRFGSCGFAGKRTRIEQYQERIIDSQDKQERSRPVPEVKKGCGQCEIEPNWRE